VVTDPSPAAEKKQPKLRWYQWRLRSLFILTLLVAIGMSWLTVTIQNQRKQKAAVKEIVKAGGSVSVGYQPTWLGKLLRDESLADVVYLDLTGRSITEDMLVQLEELKQLETLALANSNIGDAGLMHLQGLKQLQFLTLGGTQVTDQGVKQLQQALPSCKMER
jgi:hypothetical protein